jgi:3-hydroxyacyl-CoA dehydrogenase
VCASELHARLTTASGAGMAHPMGPLKLADFIGLDTVLSIQQTMLAETGDSKYRPSILLARMVDAGWVGKSACGCALCVPAVVALTLASSLHRERKGLLRLPCPQVGRRTRPAITMILPCMHRFTWQTPGD